MMRKDEATIYLVRHGEAAAGWDENPDPSLSSIGEFEAQGVSEKLLNIRKPVSRILSSPLARARETAAPLVNATLLPLEIDSAYRELPSAVPLAERRLWLKGLMDQRWSTQDALLKEWRSNILESLLLLSGQVAVFTHFMVLNVVVGYLRDSDDILSFRPANGSITVVTRSNNRLSIGQLGEEAKSRVN